MSLALREARIAASPLSRWDARWKLSAFAILAVAVSLLNHPLPIITAVLVSVVLASVAKITPVLIFARLLLLSLGLIPIWLVLPFTTENGTLLAATLTLRLLAIGTLSLVLLRTTPMPLLLAAAHLLYVPGVLIQITQLAYRYAFLFFDEARRLRIALKVRGFRARTSAHTYRTTGHTVGTLLVRGGERAERVADAMRCRGYDGGFHCLQGFRTTGVDVGAFLVMAALAVAAVWWDTLE